MEIGSEFWIDKLPVEYEIGIPEWISRYGKSVLTSCGRGAISLLLQIAKPKIKTALLPAYMCETVILPFIEGGYKCYFYDTNMDMSPNIEDIEQYKDIGIFLHTGYFGFQTNNSLTAVIKRMKSEDVIIVEDITHTLFSDYQRFDENDYYVASLRKWMGLPSGGFLTSRNSIGASPEVNETFAKYRIEALQMKAYYMKNGSEALKEQFMSLFTKGERFLNNDLKAYRIDTVSLGIINTLNHERLIETRRANYNVLLNGLKGIKYMLSIFDELEEGICPLFYPIYIEECRSEVRQKLINERIYCPIHWPIPPQIEIDSFRNTERLYNTVLSIPCDQRYGTAEMERIVTVLREIKLID
jgi:dTDP-4-amino-4,6-dideoxygalactose transaminase